MTELNTAQRSAIAGNHDTWLAGLYAGRNSVYVGMTLDEAMAANPYLVDGEDPLKGRRG